VLDRILAIPHIERIVPQLKPEVLHRVIQVCGLEDCGELIALATSEQLARVFDVDLWRAGRPGRDDALDAHRFGVWLDVMANHDVSVAARKLAGMDTDLLSAALAQHVRVFDAAALTCVAGEGDDIVTAHSGGLGSECELGGYVVCATRDDSWDAIVSVLACLDAEHPDVFHRVMRGCCRLSNSGREIDGLDDLLTEREQALFDLASAREQRRENQGYVTPAEARAFLEAAREAPLASGLTQADAGVVPPQPRALVKDSREHAPRLARIHRYMQAASHQDPVAYSKRSEELAYLANAIVSGCSQPFSPHQASRAAAAVCNLGLENWPAAGSPGVLSDDFLVGHDLDRVFEVGWSVLHQRVAMHAAERLIAVLSELRCGDRTIQAGLDALRVKLEKHVRTATPWGARDALDVIASLDLPVWAALMGVIAELPVLPDAITATRNRAHTIDASAFELISENSQIAMIQEFLQSLPDALRS
jgi:hypothetical protein